MDECGLALRVRVGKGQFCGFGKAVSNHGQIAGDYPRACGVCNAICWAVVGLYGLPPRLRGLHLLGCGRGTAPWIIPMSVGSASAVSLRCLSALGHPHACGVCWVCQTASGLETDYPHACGVCGSLAIRIFVEAGLSPCLWGGLVIVATVVGVLRSIPACGGLTRCWTSVVLIAVVYPWVLGVGS